MHLDNAYQRFFKGLSGFPKFKKKQGHQSYQCPQDVKVNFNAGTIFIPKVKEVPAVISRIFEGQIKTCTVSRTTTDKYYISVLVDNKKTIPTKPSPLCTSPQKAVYVSTAKIALTRNVKAKTKIDIQSGCRIKTETL